MRRPYLPALLLLASFATETIAQKFAEPGWSMTMLTIAGACGADRSKVNQAANYIALWAARNVRDPSEFTQEKILKIVDEDKEIQNVVKEKDAFIHPCDRWRQMLDVFLASKGSVMDKK
ncbi:hypothetical protein ACVIIV_002980 [Bradyrhizobium sp. USDA 4354]